MNLSVREKLIKDMITAGLDIEIVSKKTKLSQRTIYFYLANMLLKKTGDKK